MIQSCKDSFIRSFLIHSNPFAAYSLSWQVDDNKRKAELVKMSEIGFKKFVDAGDQPLAIASLGHMWIWNATVKNEASGLALIRRSASRGHAFSQDCLGRIYMSGELVERDVAKALELLNKSKAQGYPYADEYLSYCYAQGFGVARDVNLAKQYKASFQAQKSRAGVFV